MLYEEKISIRPFGNASGLHDPQSLLDSMGIELVNPLDKEIKVAISPNTYSRKKVEKELQRLTTTVNYGHPKGFRRLNRFFF